MKKAIAVLLALIMLISCAPVTVFAADAAIDGVQINSVQTLSSDLTIKSGEKYIVSSTWTISAELTIEAGATLEVVENGYVNISQTGRIDNYGTITVKKFGAVRSFGKGDAEGTAPFCNRAGATLTLNNNCRFIIEESTFAYNAGTINNIDRMTIDGTLYHFVKYPQNFEASYKKTEMWDRTDKTVKFTIEHVNDSELEKELDYLDAKFYNSVPKEGGWCEHGIKEYILISPDAVNGDWVDTGRIQLVINGTLFDTTERIDNARGVFTITPVGAMNISIHSYKYKDIVKLFNILLPRTEGYFVQSIDGAIDEVTVEYGKTFSFTVVLNEEYDKSEPYVYVNGVYIPADEFGYFDITGKIVDYTMATTGGVQNDLSITVMGVNSNVSQEKMSGIVNFVKQIFDTIMSIFGYFGDLFEGLFGGLMDGTETA